MATAAASPMSQPPSSYMGAWGSGAPTPPAFTPIYDPTTMAQLPGYENYLNNNSQGYNAFKAMALRPGPSNWASLADTQQAMEAQDQKNKAVQDSGASTGAAMNNLAMQGGLSSGARERAQESGANQLAGAEQGISRQEGLNKLQIGMNDEQNRMSELGQLPGMEAQRTSGWEGVRGQDNSNQMAENQALNQYYQNLYQQQGQMFGASQMANAMANSQPTGFFSWAGL